MQRQQGVDIKHIELQLLTGEACMRLAATFLILDDAVIALMAAGLFEKSSASLCNLTGWNNPETNVALSVTNQVTS